MALPTDVFVESEEWRLTFNAPSSEVAVSGGRQYGGSVADVWQCDMTIAVPEKARAAWNGYVIGLRGSLLTETTIGPTVGPFVLGTINSVAVTFTGAGAAGATSQTLTATGQAVNIIANSFFGVGGRLYWITAVSLGGANTADIQFWPPLRAAVTSGTQLSANPRTKLRLMTPTFAPALSRGVARLNLSWEEVIG